MFCDTGDIIIMARILNTAQAAEKLQVRPITVRRYLKSGLLQGRRIGREWRVMETDIETFVRGYVKKSTSARVTARGFLEGLPGFGSEIFLKNKQEEIKIENMQSHFKVDCK